MPESIAWLLNIRGGDVPHTPLPLSFAILRQDGAVDLFIDRRKLVPGLDRHLGNAVTRRCRPSSSARRSTRLARRGRRVQVDPATAASWVFDRLDAGGRARSIAPPIRACCRRRARTRPSSTARARRIAATARR